MANGSMLVVTARARRVFACSTSDDRSVVVANGVGSIRFNASGSSLYLAIKSPLLYLGSSIGIATLFLARFWC